MKQLSGLCDPRGGVTFFASPVVSDRGGTFFWVTTDSPADDVLFVWISSVPTASSASWTTTLFLVDVVRSSWFIGRTFAAAGRPVSASTVSVFDGEVFLWTAIVCVSGAKAPFCTIACVWCRLDIRADISTSDLVVPGQRKVAMLKMTVQRMAAPTRTILVPAGRLSWKWRGTWRWRVAVTIRVSAQSVIVQCMYVVYIHTVSIWGSSSWALASTSTGLAGPVPTTQKIVSTSLILSTIYFLIRVRLPTHRAGSERRPAPGSGRWRWTRAAAVSGGDGARASVECWRVCRDVRLSQEGGGDGHVTCCRPATDPDASAEEFESLEWLKSIGESWNKRSFGSCHYVNGWKPAVRLSDMSQNFCLFHVCTYRIYPF